MHHMYISEREFLLDYMSNRSMKMGKMDQTWVKNRVTVFLQYHTPFSQLTGCSCLNVKELLA